MVGKLMLQDESHENKGLSLKSLMDKRQKCFIGYTESAPWSDDLISVCNEILTLPKFNLEPDYASKHFDPSVTLREKALELIANSRYGIYDLSYRKDQQGNWHLPHNVFIELGIAIALNRPTLLLRHANNKHIELPECLKSASGLILEFSGATTLKKELNDHLDEWLVSPPERDWLKRHCTFGNKICEFREAHPRSKQWGKQILNCYISDGPDVDQADFRGVVEEVLERFRDIRHTYLDSLQFTKGYDFLLCSHCQTIRSTSFTIYRITPSTTPEAFIAIGMSLALEKQFDYKIHQLVFVEQLQDLPSLLSGFEVAVAQTYRERKECLRKFLPFVINKVRETSWKPRDLPQFNTLYDEQSNVVSNVDQQIPLLLEQANELFKGRLYDQAAEILSKVIAIDEANVPARIRLGETFIALRRLVESERTLNEALTFQPNNTEIHTLLGQVLTDMERFDEARTIFERAIELDTNDVRVWLGLAGLSEQIRRISDAERYYRDAVVRFPQNNEALSALEKFLLKNSSKFNKVRLYDLAKELKLDTKRLIDEVRRAGADVSVPSNSISRELADKIRKKYFPNKEGGTPRALRVVKKAVRPVADQKSKVVPPTKSNSDKKSIQNPKVLKGPSPSVISKPSNSGDMKTQTGLVSAEQKGLSPTTSFRVVKLVRRKEPEEK